MITGLGSWLLGPAGFLSFVFTILVQWDVREAAEFGIIQAIFLTAGILYIVMRLLMLGGKAILRTQPALVVIVGLVFLSYLYVAVIM